MVRRCFLACAVVLLSLWTAPAFAQAGRCSNAAPPAPAATLGYNTRIFCDDWPDLTSIDVNNTCQTQTTPGDCINSSTGKPYKWFPFYGWPSVGRCAGVVDREITCQSMVTALPSYIALHPGGGLDFTASPPSIITQANGVNNPVGGAITSCRTNGQNNQWIGFLLPAASYLRANFIHMPDPTPGDAMQPVLWAEPIEMLAASAATAPPIPNPWVEWDWIETGFSTGIAHVLEWQVGDGQVIPGSAWGYWPSTTNLTLGSLLTPMSLGGGTGSLYGYINDAIPPTGSNAPAAPLTWTAGGRFSEIENQHFCLILWAAQTTVSVGSIEVWAAGGAPLPRPASGADLRKFLHRR
jgi:hypothetical protein